MGEGASGLGAEAGAGHHGRCDARGDPYSRTLSRSLERGTTPQRLNELAEALAYWAARYQELPGSPGGALTLTPADAIQRVERLDPSRRTAGLIFDAVRALDDDGFAPAINLVSPGDDADTFVSALTRTFVRHYLADAGSAAIGFIHSVTARVRC